jgi:hypothetical protein
MQAVYLAYRQLLCTVSQPPLVCESACGMLCSQDTDLLAQFGHAWIDKERGLGAVLCCAGGCAVTCLQAPSAAAA